MPDFMPPDFLQGQDEDTIYQRMKARAPADIDTSEGSFFWDVVRPVAGEKAEMMGFTLIEAIKLIYPQYAYGTWLDLHAEIRGLSRRAATKANGYVHVTGTPGTVIPAGFIFATPASDYASSAEFATKAEAVLNENGEADIEVEAVEAGPNSNATAGSVTVIFQSLQGVSGVTNPEAITGGTSEESDDNLRDRILEYDRTQGTSFIGNLTDYVRWAKEVDGVGTVIPVEPTADDGVITLIISDMEGNAATEELCVNVYNHIMSPDNPMNRLAPINAYLSVVPPEAVTIDITANIKATTDINVITDNFEQLLKSYYPTAITEGEVKYAKIGKLLLDTAGVADYDGSTLLVNGGKVNIPLSKAQSPVTGSVVLTAI
jgi:uncharacterized phage protein gp47/JayE